MPPDNIASGQSAARQRYRDLLRRLQSESRSLSDQVGKGRSRKETENLYLRIQEIGRNTAEEARRMFLSSATIDEIQKAEDRMNQLRVYYLGSAEPRPALVGPSKHDGEGAKKGK